METVEESPIFQNSFLTVQTEIQLERLDGDEDISSWFNDILTGSAVAEEERLSLPVLESKLNVLLTQLDTACSDTSAQVDRSIEEISRSVPRLSFDLQLMREHALILRFTLDGIRKSSLATATPSNDSSNAGTIAIIDPNTSSVLDRLQVLDTLKTRMEASRDVLREAESWSTLDSEVTAYISEQAYSKAADRLAEASKSMIVFEHTPEYEARRALMISLQNSLEASLSASLVKAITGRDVKACRAYFTLFTQIQREAEFRNYYYGSRRNALFKKWQSIELTDCRPIIPTDLPPVPTPDQEQVKPTQPMSLADFLPIFYNDLASILDEERAYIPQIFPDPLTTLSTFVQTTLDALIPSFHQRLSEVSDSRSTQFLPELIKCYHATEEFAVKTEQIISQLYDPSPFDASPAETPNAMGNTSVSGPNTPSNPSTPAFGQMGKERRRLSKRYSVSARRTSLRPPSFSATSTSNISNYFPSASALFGDFGGDENAKAWEIALFEPFLDFQVEYATLENGYLTHCMNETYGGSASNSWDQLGTSAATKARTVMDQFQTTVVICEDALSRSVALTHGYGSAEYVRAADDCISTYLSSQKTALNRAKTQRQVQIAQGRITDARAQDTVSFEGLEYSSDDWAIFQLGLKLLGTCQQITTRISSLEGKIRSRLASLAHMVQEASKDPLGHTIPGTTGGAVTLLRQSTLNSAGLASVFENVSSNQKLHAVPLLSNTRTAAIEFSKASQLLLHDTILGPLLGSLASYPTLSVWVTNNNARTDLKSAFDVTMPTFSLSPTDIISRLGEGLFNLPRLFEVYADDDALAFSIETLPFVQQTSLPLPSIPPPSPSPTPNKRQSLYGDFDLSLTSRRRSSLGDIEVPTSATHSRKEPEEAKPLSAEVVISAWLTSLTTAVLAHLTNNILPELRLLSTHGASQLASDLGHLSNVAKALDVETEDLEHWRECVEMSDAEGKKALLEATQKDAIFNQVAKLRNWT